ncbi:MAG: recombinase A [Dehalococcoidia bacterium]|nr:recombinase A [Dehalococcoidia bacterium]
MAAPAVPQRRPVRDTARTWSLSSLAGRLTEVSDSGAAPSLTAAAALILQAQQRGEPAAWIGFGNSIFFPPDFAEWGIDLDALPVIRVPDAPAASRAADQLLRSGAFGLVVLDLKSQAQMHLAVQSRLAALARKHHAALLCLTRKRRGTPSLGPLVALHGEGRISRTAFSRFDWEIRMVKDKRGAPGWSHTESCRGTDGLC